MEWPKSQLHWEFTRPRIRYTEPRNQVFIALKRLEPCSLEELTRTLDNQVSRRTVSRTVALLIREGLAVRPEGKLIYLATRAGFAVTAHSVAILGICRSCGQNP